MNGSTARAVVRALSSPENLYYADPVWSEPLSLRLCAWSPFQKGFQHGVFFGSGEHPMLNAELDRLAIRYGVATTCRDPSRAHIIGPDRHQGASNQECGQDTHRLRAPSAAPGRPGSPGQPTATGAGK